MFLVGAGQKIDASISVQVGSGVQDDPARPGQKVLYVIGTSGNDNINVRKQGAQVEVVRNGVSQGRFSSATFGRIIILGLSGNDTINVYGTLNIPTVAYGNEGNDSINTGRGAAHRWRRQRHPDRRQWRRHTHRR